MLSVFFNIEGQLYIGLSSKIPTNMGTSFFSQANNNLTDVKDELQSKCQLNKNVDENTTKKSQPTLMRKRKCQCGKGRNFFDTLCAFVYTF